MSASSLVAIGMYLFFQWRFEEEFLNYINQRERNHLTQFATTLSQEYSQYGHWGFIANNPRRWMELLRKSDPEGRINPSFLPPSPPHEFRGKNDRKKPPQRKFSDRPPRFKDGKPHRGERPPHGRPPPPDRRPRGPQGFQQRINLYDIDKSLLFGPPVDPENRIYEPIIHQQQIVGYVGLLPRKSVSETLELVFLQEQNRTFLVIAGLALAFSFLFALISAGHLVKPIRNLTKTTKALTSGRFETRSNVESLDEIGDLSKDLNLLAKTLQTNESARQKWIADISHELRTPLAILRGEIEAILDGIRKADEASLRSLHSEVVQLARIVNDLYELSLSDLGALDYRKTDVDLVEEINVCINAFQNSYERKNIFIKRQFDSESAIEVFADQARLHQLFTNLLKNTLRYTDTGGLLEIQLSQTDNSVIIDFRDSAPGVPDQKTKLLFDPLFRLEESRNKSFGGAGLGLAICKNIVEAHDGKIEAKSSPLGGLWITIRLNRL